MRVVFMGTATFAVPALEALIRSRHEVAAVVTKPDRPAGRGLFSLSSPVKGAALAHGLTILEPETMKDENVKQDILEAHPDIIVVAAYGKILPAWCFDEVSHGAVNIHGSMLPEYRGAAPIQRAIMDGKSSTGVTIIRMDAGIDTGEILASQEVVIGTGETAGQLENKMGETGASLLIKTLDGIESGSIKAVKQPENGTYAEKIDKDEARIHLEGTAEKANNLIRAMNPQPGAYIVFKGKRVKAWKAALAPQGRKLKPGEVASVNDEGIEIGFGTGVLKLIEVQPESKKTMSAAEFARGSRIREGDMFDVLS